MPATRCCAGGRGHGPLLQWRHESPMVRRGKVLNSAGERVGTIE